MPAHLLEASDPGPFAATPSNRNADFPGNSMPSGLFFIDWHAARKE
jgi:hypothetical protein